MRFTAPNQYTYSQSFEFGAGELLFEFHFRVEDDDDEELVLDEQRLGLCAGISSRFTRDGLEQTLYFSSFCDELWKPSGVPHASPSSCSSKTETSWSCEAKTATAGSELRNIMVRNER